MSQTVTNSAFKLLPCRKDVCQECAVDHSADQPHNQQSLYYQYRFFEKHGRWPTWADALAHCAEDVRTFWIEELAKHGVVVEAKEEKPCAS